MVNDLPLLAMLGWSHAFLAWLEVTGVYGRFPPLNMGLFPIG